MVGALRVSGLVDPLTSRFCHNRAVHSPPIMQIEPTRHRRTTAEVLTALVALCSECRAVAIGRDARRLHEATPVALLHLCLRLRHHLHEMNRAIGRTRQQNRARHKAVVLTRTALEAYIDRRAHQGDPIRGQLVSRFALARTKFVMSAKADALSELALRASHHDRRWQRVDTAMDAAQIAREHLAGMWVRIVRDVHAPVTALAKQLCAEVECSLAEFGETVQADALVDLAPPALGTFDDEMGGRLRLLRADLGTLLELGANAITHHLVEYYDSAVRSLAARLLERLDSIEATVLAAGQFADDALRDDGDHLAHQCVMLWSSRLGLLVDDLS
jgi:hypothetical protein